MFRYGSIVAVTFAGALSVLAQTPQDVDGHQVTLVALERTAKYGKEQWSLTPKDQTRQLVIARIDVALAQGKKDFTLKPNTARLVDSAGKKYDSQGIEFQGSWGPKSSWNAVSLIYSPAQGVVFIDGARGMLITLDSTKLPAPVFFTVPIGVELKSLTIGKAVFDLSGFPAAKGT